MGYESRIFVVDRHERGDWRFGDEIARFELCKMGYEFVNGKMFRDIFDKPIDFDLYNTGNVAEDNEDEDNSRLDLYGEYCRYTDIDTVIKWLEGRKNSPDYEPYRRLELFLDSLYTIKKHESDYGNIVLVHYGH